MKYLITSIFCVFAFISAQANIYIVETNKATLGECDGSITIHASGEAGLFSFTIVNTAPNGQQPSNTTYEDIQGEFTIEGLCPGDYSISHEDSFGCGFTLNGTVEIEECSLVFVAVPDKIFNSTSCIANGALRSSMAVAIDAIQVSHLAT